MAKKPIYAKGRYQEGDITKNVKLALPLNEMDDHEYMCIVWCVFHAKRYLDELKVTENINKEVQFEKLHNLLTRIVNPLSQHLWVNTDGKN